ncbi:urea ABC transporter permease subunit UrtC [Halothiobacillus neapolitanus]|uniref:Urea ABC transporter, permease protein UrtC n=1 Tax=Halothiobacillus neapolitanus (strain ATCC 23641 / DSM 15147 / CIP 104769 / NCIMB 8539 / c2) TaxID=555778 RepID=D0KZR4_HALNC|nr:urea ABC transporter permease subunit UrtC [Halothiobacillus neapolitanus]ACX95937.1 urea ABC transporter, permease protein UrtC [Halothiobacillus neapolitanus c2]TDN66245.1 amino acid/amide ABC transporter membrane protein 2 (HAAT family) [Halothiobacillus neapolitanus]
MLFKTLFAGHERGGLVVMLAIVLMLLWVSIGNLAVPASSPWHVSTYTVTILGKFLTYALLAVSIDLIWGYAGILSLGHGAFFALGGYAMGMYLMREIGDRGQYGNPDLPDFMVFLNWHELPWYWYGFDHFWFAALMVLLVPGILAGLFGWLAFRSKVSGVYFAIITQALTYALMLAFFRNEMGFGGNNGLTDFKDILGFPIAENGTRVGLFVASGIALILGYFIAQAIVRSRFGRVLVAIRDAEPRTRACGYPVARYKLVVFVISAMLAAVAGALYVPQVGIINPGEFSPLSSIEAVAWVATGGRGSLFGPIIGAFAVNYSKTQLTSLAPDLWPFVLGGLFILVTVFLPKGLISLLARRKKAHKPAADKPTTSPATDSKPEVL